MTEVTFHRLTQDNAGLLATSQVFDHPIRPDQLDRFVSDPGHILVFAVLHKDVVGFASGTVLLHPDKAPAFFVNEVDVAPKQQRRGIGKALCERLLTAARDLGCEGIWLATEDENMAARALYKSLNARESTGIVVYDWDDAMGA